MKKILLASTILVGSAGIAAADISWSGDAEFGMAYNGATWAAFYGAGIDFAMVGETDGGLEFGATVGFDANDTTVNDTSVWISGGFGKIAVGDVDTASAGVLGGLSDIGITGLGVDNRAEDQWATDNANILYTHAVGDFEFGVSYDTVSDDYGVAGKYTFGDYYVGLGYQNDGGDNEYSLQAGATFGDFGVNILYINDTTNSVYSAGIDASYTTGAVTITAAYGTFNGTVDAYGLGASYDLGGGASVQAGVASVAGTTVADFGVSMEF